MEIINLCSRYEQCSKDWRCVNPNPSLKEGCTYRSYLEDGINFYNEDVLSRTYILLKNRLFYVGVMGHCSSRTPGDLERELLERYELPLSEYNFGQLHLDEKKQGYGTEDMELYHIIDENELELLVVDQGTEENRCQYVVTFTLEIPKEEQDHFAPLKAKDNQVTYLIRNFNIRAVPYDIAVEVKKSFMDLGIPSALIRMGQAPRASAVQKKGMKKNPTKEENINEEVPAIFMVDSSRDPSKEAEEGQMDMFGLLGATKAVKHW